MMKQKEKNNAGKILLILVLLIVLAGAGAGGFYAFQTFLADPGPDFQMKNIHLNQETIAFAFHSLPNVYQGLAAVNTELVLIDTELQRLDKLEKEYPKQKKIVMEEKKMWNDLRKDLETTVDDLEKRMETLFVSYTVNPEKGSELLTAQGEELLAVVNKALEVSNQQTMRLKNTQKKSFIDKIKEKISK